MKKRIMAWILLAGFVLLIVNLLVFRVFWEISLISYFLIVLFYIFTFKK